VLCVVAAVVQVKVWNMSSGFCFVTFTEHTAGITGVTFTQNGQVIISASLDGTVRAFDLNRFVISFLPSL
jgi:periodic tryptophan protein 2